MMRARSSRQSLKAMFSSALILQSLFLWPSPMALAAIPRHTKSPSAHKAVVWDSFVSKSCIAANDIATTGRVGDYSSLQLSKMDSLAKQGLPSNDYLCYHILGLVSESRGQYVNAMKFYKIAARGKLTASMLNVGALYANAKGVPRNFGLAKQWYMRTIVVAQHDGDQEMVELAQSNIEINEETVRQEASAYPNSRSYDDQRRDQAQQDMNIQRQNEYYNNGCGGACLPQGQ